LVAKRLPSSGISGSFQGAQAKGKGLEAAHSTGKGQSGQYVDGDTGVRFESKKM
jgi:hypothetical protein